MYPHKIDLNDLHCFLQIRFFMIIKVFKKLLRSINCTCDFFVSGWFIVINFIFCDNDMQFNYVLLCIYVFIIIYNYNYNIYIYNIYIYNI